MNRPNPKAIRERCEAIKETGPRRGINISEADYHFFRYLTDDVIPALLDDNAAKAEEIEQLKGRKPMPFAWWKECPKLAQVTMERIIENNERLRGVLEGKDTIITQMNRRLDSMGGNC